MTTKAPPKKADPLVKVAEAEAAMTEAQEAAEASGLKLAEATERVKALQQERAPRVHDDPTLVDHRSEPVEASNPVGKIDAELSEIDLEDAELRYGHNTSSPAPARNADMALSASTAARSTRPANRTASRSSRSGRPRPPRLQRSPRG